MSFNVSSNTGTIAPVAYDKVTTEYTSDTELNRLFWRNDKRTGAATAFIWRVKTTFDAEGREISVERLDSQSD